ncbi:MAG TPA: HEAT repeat domain-containing protein [Ignavibacteria bacterium]|nr:HEAT repeat domain-containing protein [Ignavibacteria bacterium]
MKDSLLTDKKKREIVRSIKEENFSNIISILGKIKTDHANTAKTKDKRFVISEIVRYVLERNVNPERDYFDIGIFFCNRSEDVAKEIGVSLIWRGYRYDKEIVEKYLIQIADDPNWEVREYAGNAFANTLFQNHDFYKTVLSLTKHKSENVRRAVVFSGMAFREKNLLTKAFAIFEPLMFDSSKYVKKNLGPFILGSYFGNKYPVETIKQLKKWSKILDANVRWNIIMSFNNSFGKRNPEAALDVLKIFAGDADLSVKRALKSTLNSLGKNHKKPVNEFIKKYKLSNC